MQLPRSELCHSIPGDPHRPMAGQNMVSRNGVTSANGWAVVRKIVSANAAPVARTDTWLHQMAAIDTCATVRIFLLLG
jgi:hypothetical protein